MARNFSPNKVRQKNKIAHKWCKQEKSVEGREVSGTRTGDFHNLINIRVEILMQKKYFMRTSARVLPCDSITALLTRTKYRIRMLE
jgi:hypothetical protein